VIIEGLKKYFSEYTGGIEVRNSFLSENTPDFAVFAEGEKTVLKKYISGDMLCQFIFSFRARLPYGKKDEETKKISIFFSNLADWVRKKSDKNQFPKIGEGKKSMAYTVTFRAGDQMLKDEEVTRMTDKILKNLEKELGVTLR